MSRENLSFAHTWGESPSGLAVSPREAEILSILSSGCKLPFTIETQLFRLFDKVCSNFQQLCVVVYNRSEKTNTRPEPERISPSTNPYTHARYSRTPPLSPHPLQKSGRYRGPLGKDLPSSPKAGIDAPRRPPLPKHTLCFWLEPIRAGESGTGLSNIQGGVCLRSTGAAKKAERVAPPRCGTPDDTQGPVVANSQSGGGFQPRLASAPAVQGSRGTSTGFHVAS